MSIVTRTGDHGTTGLMYNRRVPKHHPRIEACGCLDELNAALGVARALTRRPRLRRHLVMIQQDLVVLMGELATDRRDLARYEGEGFSRVGPELTAKLEAVVAEMEPQVGNLRGWATPGKTTSAAALDLARTICRRAERRVCALPKRERAGSPEILVYLNRLADTLWLLARIEERRRA